MYTHTSHYIPMRDGVQIAVDLWLPALSSGEKIPAIVRQTRYLRAIQWTRLGEVIGLRGLVDINRSTRRAFLNAGYAWLDVDVRGSGASEGVQICPFSPDEVKDGAEIVDWIIRQPWSSGKVGATGISYDGTCAEMLATNCHPAVKAVAPRFSLFDVYPDVAFPGGLHLTWFTNVWSRMNQALDENAFHKALGILGSLNLAALSTFLTRAGRPLLGDLVGLLVGDRTEQVLSLVGRALARGVLPVEGALEVLAQAIQMHAENFDVHQGALQLTYRDDFGISRHVPAATIDLFSPHTYISSLRRSEVAVYSYSGWYDGAYQHSAIKRHLNLAEGKRKLILGPWDHGGMHSASPAYPSFRPGFDHDEEQLRFFDYHVKGADNGAMEPAVRYYTMNEERWKTAERWPPPGFQMTSWYLRAGQALSPTRPEEVGQSRYRIDQSLGTGECSRWRSLIGLGVPVGYGDQARLSARRLCFTSEPLSQDIEVTGHPLLTVFLSADAPDVGLFAYLEEVLPSGQSRLVTEGQLRFCHRKISDYTPYQSATPYRSFIRQESAPLVPGEPVGVLFDLLPVSYLFREKSRLRLSLAGADKDHFAPVPQGASHFDIYFSPERLSCLTLPIRA